MYVDDEEKCSKNLRLFHQRLTQRRLIQLAGVLTLDFLIVNSGFLVLKSGVWGIRDCQGPSYHKPYLLVFISAQRISETLDKKGR